MDAGYNNGCLQTYTSIIDTLTHLIKVLTLTKEEISNLKLSATEEDISLLFKLNEWIRIDDINPPLDTLILVSDGIDVGLHVRYREEWVPNDSLHNGPVKLWMPIPELPPACGEENA